LLAVPAAATLVDSTPRLRAKADSVVGRPAADALFAVGGAVGQALARRPMGLLSDAGYRMCLRREIDARRQAWQRWEASVADRPQVHHSDPLDRVKRPAPMPNGPVERVANTSATLALVVTVLAYALVFDRNADNYPDDATLFVVMVKVHPLPSSLSTLTSPPSIRLKWRVMTGWF